jgi:uncharacterized membrane protein YkvA (DUF1232 family)
MLKRLRGWARSLKADTMVLYFAVRDPRTPLAAKLVAMAVVAYALSPIDLIPDFIPVLGLLDDLILLPLGIALALRLIPAAVLADARARAAAVMRRPRNLLAAAAIILLWLALAGICGVLLWRHWPG